MQRDIACFCRILYILEVSSIFSGPTDDNVHVIDIQSDQSSNERRSNRQLSTKVISSLATPHHITIPVSFRSTSGSLQCVRYIGTATHVTKQSSINSATHNKTTFSTLGSGGWGKPHQRKRHDIFTSRLFHRTKSDFIKRTKQIAIQHNPHILALIHRFNPHPPHKLDETDSFIPTSCCPNHHSHSLATLAQVAGG